MPENSGPLNQRGSVRDSVGFVQHRRERILPMPISRRRRAGWRLLHRAIVRQRRSRLSMHLCGDRDRHSPSIPQQHLRRSTHSGASITRRYRLTRTSISVNLRRRFTIAVSIRLISVRRREHRDRRIRHAPRLTRMDAPLRRYIFTIGLDRWLSSFSASRWTCGWLSARVSRTAFAAIASGDPQYCDTGAVPDRGDSFGFSTETNNSGVQGWFNEMSVATLVYDLWDTNAPEQTEPTTARSASARSMKR